MNKTESMKTYTRIAFIYMIAGIVCGVFYREFTKYNGFTGRTTLGFTHLHLLVLGMILFLILAVFVVITNIDEQKNFKKFLLTYNIGLPFMVVMLIVRGILQVLGTPLTTGQSAMISGVAGLAHITVLAAFLFLFSCFKSCRVTLKNE